MAVVAVLRKVCHITRVTRREWRLEKGKIAQVISIYWYGR